MGLGPWIILILYAVVGISTSILMHSWWRRYDYWASTVAAAISAAIFIIGIILLDGNPHNEIEAFMMAILIYFFFIPLTFATGALFKLFRPAAAA